jgi:hypothetical protein
VSTPTTSCWCLREETMRSEGLNELGGTEHCPSWTGGVARSAGVVVQMFYSSLNNHPVRSLSMLRDFLNVAATPPVQEG